MTGQGALDTPRPTQPPRGLRRAASLDTPLRPCSGIFCTCAFENVGQNAQSSGVHEGRNLDATQMSSNSRLYQSSLVRHTTGCRTVTMNQGRHTQRTGEPPCQLSVYRLWAPIRLSRPCLVRKELDAGNVSFLPAGTLGLRAEALRGPRKRKRLLVLVLGL